MNQPIACSALAVAASVSMTAFAQTNPPNDTTRLDPIIVSAGISPVAADQYGRSHTVITRRDIEERGYATVQQALEAQPGVSINGDAPSNRQVRIRGAEANHTLILVDGVRVDAGSTSGYNLRSIDISTVEKIEVLRGPQSVPYGTDAAAGVINIVTRESVRGLSAGGFAELGGGDRESAYIVQSNEDIRFSFTLSNSNDEGFDYSGSGGEKDSVRSRGITSKGEYDVNRTFKLGYSYRIFDVNYDLDSAAGSGSAEAYVQDNDSNETKVLERASSFYIERKTRNGALSHRLRLDALSNQSSSLGDQKTDLLNYRAQWAADGEEIASSDSLLSFLLERKEDSEKSSDSERSNDSIALDYNATPDNQFGFQAGIRYDHSDEFEDAVSWNAAASYSIDLETRLKASVGRSVIYPQFFDIFGGEFPGIFFPNGKDQVYQSTTDVKPEKNFGYDLGVERTFMGGHAVVAATYFSEKLTNEIYAELINETDAVETYRAANRDQDSEREGLELSGDMAVNQRLSLRANYTYIRSTDAEGSREGRRPRHEVGFGLTLKPSDIPLTLSGDLRHVGGLYDQQFFEEGDPLVELPSFTTVDVSAEYTFSPKVTLVARVTNAFDEDYQEVWGYATRGRAGSVGVRASW